MANSFYSSARGACRTRREKWRKNNTSLSASSAARRVQARQLATRRKWDIYELVNCRWHDAPRVSAGLGEFVKPHLDAATPYTAAHSHTRAQLTQFVTINATGLWPQMVSGGWGMGWQAMWHWHHIKTPGETSAWFPSMWRQPVAEVADIVGGNN